MCIHHEIKLKYIYIQKKYSYVFLSVLLSNIMNLYKKFISYKVSFPLFLNANSFINTNVTGTPMTAANA